MGALVRLAQINTAPNTRHHGESATVIPINFPKEPDRETLMAAINLVLAKGDAYRDQMYFTMTYYMHLYKLQQVDVGEAVVKYDAKRGMRIEAKQVISGNHCPQCNAGIYTSPRGYSKRPVKLLHFNTMTGWYHYGCSCGSIFKKREGVGDD